jgi:hypothetical protein
MTFDTRTTFFIVQMSVFDVEITFLTVLLVVKKTFFDVQMSVFIRWQHVSTLKQLFWRFYLPFKQLFSSLIRHNPTLKWRVHSSSSYTSVKWYKFYLTARCCYFTIISHHSLKLKNEKKTDFQMQKCFSFPELNPLWKKILFKLKKNKCKSAS